MSQMVIKRDENGFRRLMRTDEVSVLIPLLVIILIATIIRRDFLTVTNFKAIFTQLPFVAICALGCCFPLMTGSNDISTGSVSGFTGIMMASLLRDAGWSVVPAILVAVACALAIGVINGLLIVKAKLDPFIATLGTHYMVGGARYLFIHGYQLLINASPEDVAAGTGTGVYVPLVEFFDNRILGMLPYFWVMFILFIVVYIIVKKTTVGRKFLAVGDNAEVAQLAGIPVEKMRFAAFVISALFAAIAGLLLTLDVGIGLPETGDGWNFRAVAGCVVGGVSLKGGKCSPLGILLGVTLMFVAEAAIIFVGLPGTLRISVRGLLMAAAVLFDTYRQRKKVPA